MQKFEFTIDEIRQIFNGGCSVDNECTSRERNEEFVFAIQEIINGRRRNAGVGICEAWPSAEEACEAFGIKPV